MRSNKLMALVTLASVAAGVAPIGLGAGSASAQVTPLPTATRRFDAASVKPSRRDALAGGGFRIEPGHFLADNTTVEALVRFAYGLEFGEKEAVAGGPAWLRSDRFQVEARGEATTASALEAMVRSLLADRFKLRLHEEKRDREVYVLTLVRRDGTFGPALRPTSPAEAAHCAAIESHPPATPEITPDGLKRCAASFRGGMKLRGRPLADLTDMLGELVERTVIDRTGLDQRFDADLDAALNWDHLAGGASSDIAGTNAVIFTALREQLGLKLESGRDAVRTIVIDSVERPAPD
jgi:uncharacterized protein (TIGR03435 family)